jgi:hypothetical protein
VRGRLRSVLLLVGPVAVVLPAGSAVAAAWTPGPMSTDPHVAGVSVKSGWSGAGRSGVFTLTITPDQRADNALRSNKTLRVDLDVKLTQPGNSFLHRHSIASAHWS